MYRILNIKLFALMGLMFFSLMSSESYGRIKQEELKVVFDAGEYDELAPVVEFAEFTEFLNRNNQIEGLSVNYYLSRVTPEQLLPFFSKMRECSKLTQLSVRLYSDKYGQVGVELASLIMEQIMSVVKVLPGLTDLTIAGTPPLKDKFVTLADFVRHNSTLRKLSLGGNHIVEPMEDILPLIEALKVNHSLKAFEYNGARIKSELLDALAQVLNQNRSIEFLSLAYPESEGNWIKEGEPGYSRWVFHSVFKRDSVKVFAEALAKSNLKRIDLTSSVHGYGRSLNHLNPFDGSIQMIVEAALKNEGMKEVNLSGQWFERIEETVASIPSHKKFIFEIFLSAKTPHI